MNQGDWRKPGENVYRFVTCISVGVEGIHVYARVNYLITGNQVRRRKYKIGGSCMQLLQRLLCILKNRNCPRLRD